MLYEYTIIINEKREDGKVYLCYEKTHYFGFDHACRKAAKLIDRMTGELAGVVIFKNLIGGYGVPTSPIRYGTSYFNEVDYYL